MCIVYIICVSCVLIATLAQPPRPHIPEDFNATLGPAVFFHPILKGLDLEVNVHFNTTNPDDYPLTLSDTDSLLGVTVYKIYYNLKTDYLYLVYENGTCSKIPAEDVNVAALLAVPSFFTFILVEGFNSAQNCTFVKTFEKCPYSKTRSCDLWTFRGSNLLSRVYQDDPTFDAYLTANETPIAMGPSAADPKVILIFKTFHKGIQNPSKFLPPHPEQCKQENLVVF